MGYTFVVFADVDADEDDDHQSYDSCDDPSSDPASI